MLRASLDSASLAFDGSVFFQLLAANRLPAPALRHVFGQYAHFCSQLHRWVAACLLLTRDAIQPAQSQAVQVLAAYDSNELRESRDRCLTGLLQDLSLPIGPIHVPSASPATTAYLDSCVEHCSSPTTWVEALAALSGCELAIVLRNRRLIQSRFTSDSLSVRTYFALHAALDFDQFLALVQPTVPDANGPAPAQASLNRALQRHVDYIDALLHEHDPNSATLLRDDDLLGPF